jgi:hypothetical protein
MGARPGHGKSRAGRRRHGARLDRFDHSSRAAALEAKHYVRRERDGRQFLYSSAREPRKVAAEAVRSALKNFCRGSLEELLTGHSRLGLASA